MKLFDYINEVSLEVYTTQVDTPSHLLLSINQLRELKQEYQDLFGDEQPNFSISDIEETLGMVICVTASNKIVDKVEFLKKVRTGNK